ncbi:MAG TPA: M48 family metallopeptidase [Oleiagrimonas sp.]|nr:M48 family metallopeptidase [Oleiagrimonas sp.]
MDFFAQQAKVRRSSRWLVVLFVLAVVAVIVAVDIVFVLAFGWHERPSQVAGAGAAMQGSSLHLNWIAIAEVSAVVLVLIGVASLYRAASLRGGGSVVALGMGATPVPADTGNPVWRRLRNVIEEVAIASGVPVPDIFVLEGESGINAFAAGYTPSDAAVCVTQGCLDRLTRDELQGVIAHEFSHVLNGDMRLNIRLMGLLFGILVLSIIGRFMMFSGAGVRSRGSNTAYLALIGIAVIAVGYVGYFFGRLIQAAVSRSRESLADASAVQFTRQTDGIAGALKKIAALQEGSRLAAHNKHEVAHMLFGEAGGFSRLFATHPPLPERLQALGVAWDENEMEQLVRAWQQPQRASDPEQASASLSGFAPGVASGVAATAASAGADLPDARATMAVDAAAVSAQVGAPGAGAFDLAGVLRDRLPVDVDEAVKHPRQAQALLLALAMDRDAKVRDAQLLTIDNTLGSDCAQDAEHALSQLIGVHPMQRLPLAALAFPALRRRPRPEVEKLLDTLCALVQVDHSVDLHEYCLVRLLDLQLRDLLDPSAGFTPGRKRLRQCRESFASLLALVAAHGHAGDHQAAQRAWTRALGHALPDARIAFALPENWQAAMDRALHELDALRASDKQRVVEAMAIVVGEDGVVTVAEAELLRVICASLHCPVPLLDARPQSPVDA